jgi:6-phosphogluconolactonase
MGWSRRTFLSTAGLAGVAAVSPRSLVAGGYSASAAPFLACVGFSPIVSTNMQRIEIYRVDAGTWIRLGDAVPCEAPCALVMHPSKPVLYIAHRTEQYLGLPRGSVSAFLVNADSGALMLLNRAPLSLSATHPEHLAISPDGRTLLVSASGGGSYNSFSIADEGRINLGVHALKQTGFGPHPLQATSHPHTVLFHPSGLAAYASDLGCDRINHIAFAEGVPNMVSRAAIRSGSGPGHMVLHPSGSFLVVRSTLRPELTVVALAPDTLRLRSSVQDLASEVDTAGPLAFDISGDFLYLASNLNSGETVVSGLRMESGSLRLRAIAEIRVAALGRPERLLIYKHELLLVGAGGIASLPLDQSSGLLGSPRMVVKSADAVSIATLPT